MIPDYYSEVGRLYWKKNCTNYLLSKLKVPLVKYIFWKFDNWKKSIQHYFLFSFPIRFHNYRSRKFAFLFFFLIFNYLFKHLVYEFTIVFHVVERVLNSIFISCSKSSIKLGPFLDILFYVADIFSLVEQIFPPTTRGKAIVFLS